MLIAVAPHTKIPGVEPGHPKGTGDWREEPGSEGNVRRVTPAYEVMHVSTALLRRYATEAYLVPYVIRLNGAPIMRQPRVNKDGLDWMREQGYELTIEGLVVDWDRPGHEPWESQAQAQQAVNETKGKVPTAIVYASRGGLRLIQPTRQRLRPEEAEGSLYAFLRQLETVGIVGDRACLDWTHGFRLPHVARAGGPTVDALAMVLTYEPIDAPRPVAVLRRGSSRRARTEVGPIAWSSELPPHLAALVSPLADALRAVPEGWHDTHLAISGALAKSGVDPVHLPAMALALAYATADSRPEDRRTAAETTARRYASGAEVRGMRWLAEHAPPVADVLEQAFGRVPARKPAELPSAPTDLPEVVALQIRGAIERASERLSLVVVPCGTGKTRQLREVAIQRAKKARRPDAKRAPLGTRTCISVPTHELAGQIANDVGAEGVPVLRLVGIGSYKVDGKLVCAYAAQAGALASGGLSVRLELCEGRGRPCIHRETCPARGGMIGPEDARVVVGPHALVAELDAAAGKTGLLAIDEPPALLRTERLKVEDLDHAIAVLPRMAPRYAASIRPALLAVRAWLAGLGEGDVPTGSLARAWATGADADALEWAFEATGATSIEEAAELAIDPRARSEAPPLTTEAAFEARCNAAVARRIADGARVMRDIRAACLHTVDGELRALATVEHGVLVLTLAVEGLRRAMRREGAVIVLAADADLHAPLVAQAVGYEPSVTRVAARLGAPVRRVMIEAPASRGRWLRDGKVAVRAVLDALAEGVAELEHAGCRRVLVVTFMAAERELLRLAAAADLLARVGGELAHYGGLRGLDKWRDVDGVLTLGDPRPNLGDVQREAAMLGDRDPSARLDALAAAELEQAFGRARLIHRAPDRPCLLIHVGEVMPRGWYAPVERRALGGRVRGREELRRAVAAAGGTGAAADVLGVDARTVRRWMDGARAPPLDVVRRLVPADHSADDERRP